MGAETYNLLNALQLENYIALGYYAESSGNSLGTFRDNLSFPSSRDKLILEEGNDELFRNVGKELPLFVA
jgi:hypothetical protein